MTTETATRPPAFMAKETDRKICFICSKGNLDMAYPALIMANGAVGEGIETHVFFTFWGLDMINRRTMHDLKFTLLGNTAMHPPRRFSVSMPQGLGGLPGMTRIATRMLKKQIAAQGVPEVPEFLDLLVESGVRLWACKMSVDMMGLRLEDLHPGVAGIINVAEFLELSDGAQVLFV